MNNKKWHIASVECSSGHSRTISKWHGYLWKSSVRKTKLMMVKRN